MKIQIAEKLRPFSHLPGASCLIPGTCFAITAFPTLLKLAGREIKLNLTGPVKDFTLLQDLEKNSVFVFGKAKEGYYRVRIQGSDTGFELDVEKGPLKSMRIDLDLPFKLSSSVERLSLGNHKSQDWDKVARRGDLKEMLPVLFALGQKIPFISPQPLKGTASLLELPKERPLLAEALETFLQAAFTHILVPRLNDEHHQGIVPYEEVKGNPCFLVQEGAKLVRGLFFSQNQRRISLLPHLPVPLDAGRMVGVKAPGIGEFDFEWSKKLLRRVVLRADTSGDVVFVLQKEIREYRVNKKKHLSLDPLLIEAGKTYTLDRFQK